MIFYSHSKKNETGEVYGSKELKTHIQGVKEKALFHFAENVQLGFSSDELKHLVEITAELHDLGKYTKYFQDYLLKKESINHKLKQHARLGGFTAFNLMEKEEKKALLAFYIIFLHHSQLINFSEVSVYLRRELEHVIEKQKDNLKPYLAKIEEELKIKELSSHIYYPEERKIRRGFRIWEKRQANIQDYFLINYLFSLLIEGDKLDASDTEPYVLQSIIPDAVDNRFGKPSVDGLSVEDLSHNELRNYCRAVVTSHIEEDDILKQYIFTLTAPTGIGKTMTALDFSIKLKDKVKNKTGIDSRIIYALPFINIIEQALKEYNKTLDQEKVKILGHYQYANVFGIDKEDEGSEESNYNQKVMALDTWQADIIITSFVQFFQTLIGNRNKLLMKFNHFANAIIILDEVQTLRLDQMPLLGASLFYLSKFLKSRLILMTATRPKVFELANQEILSSQNEQVNPKELLTNYEEVFARFKRTAIHPLLDELPEEADNSHYFVDFIFDDKWQKHKSCLIVCNTVKQSVEIHKAIKGYLKENQLDNPVYYLSTNIIPAHRFKRIEEIDNDLKNNKHPIVVATQVVEAGVDLDFDMGFRDIGPIDSIIQVAGRINRNNDLKKKHSPLYVLDLDPKMTIRIYGRLSYQQARKALKQQNTFNEEEYLKLIEVYFDGVSGRSSFAQSRALFDSMKKLNYHNEEKETYPVSSFRIIEKSNFYVSVFIEVDEKAEEIREKYHQKIIGDIDKEEFNQNWKLKFHQHIISVPQYLCDDCSPINEYEENILVVSHFELNEKYNLKTGFIREKQDINTAYTF